jgi:hypothetical protein
VNQYDLNSFVTAVAAENCACQGDDLPEATPEEVAADLAANIDGDWYDAMVDIVYLIIQDPRTQAEYEYWSEVYDELTP